VTLPRRRGARRRTSTSRPRSRRWSRSPSGSQACANGRGARPRPSSP